MAFAVLSATAWASRAGEGRGGGGSGGAIPIGSSCNLDRRVSPPVILSVPITGGLGNDFSTPLVPYTSTRMLPAFASARTYLPRLNPATGIGRSEVHRETFSPAVSAVFPRSSTCAGDNCFPVATSVQFAG